MERQQIEKYRNKLKRKLDKLLDEFWFLNDLPSLPPGLRNRRDKLDKKTDELQDAIADLDQVIKDYYG